MEVSFLRYLSWSMILVILLAMTGSAQESPAPATEPASREDVLKLFEVMKVHEQMRQALDQVVVQQKSMAHDMLRKRVPNITDEKLARFDGMIEESVKDMPLDDIIGDMVPIYQKHLNKADVEAMSTFYASPTGQKVLNEMPGMTSEAMQASYVRMQQRLQETMDKVEKMMKDNQAPAKPKPAPRQPAKPTT